jgi:hypothetical protein
VVRPSWLRRIGAACLLGAGAYACISLSSPDVAQAEDSTPAAVPAAADTAVQPSPANEPPADPATSSHTGSSSTPATTPEIAPGTTPTTSTPTTSPGTTTPGTATPGTAPAEVIPLAPGQDSVTEPLGDETTVPRSAGPKGAEAAVQPEGVPVPPVTQASTGAQTPVTDASSTDTARAEDIPGTEGPPESTCTGTTSRLADPCGVPVRDAADAGDPRVTDDTVCPVPADMDLSSSGTAEAATGAPPNTRAATTPAGDTVRESSAGPAAPHVTASGSGTGSPAPGAPVSPPLPVAPAPLLTGLAGCGSTSAGPSTARGTAFTVAAGPAAFSNSPPAVTDAASTAPAEGSPATAANDSSTRPD